MDLREKAIGAWVEFMWLRVGMMAGFCEYSNEHLGSIKSGTFLVYLSILFSSFGVNLLC
jgi:hypothetical protein